MPKMTIGEIRKVIADARERKRPFVVRFEKANGERRTMVCLTGDLYQGEFVKGVLEEGQRQKEDEANNVATVFSVDVFQELIDDGETRQAAGRQSWRRIPLTRCRRAEVL